MALGYAGQAVLLVTVGLVASLTKGENLQSWSHQGYKDESYSLTCNSDTYSLSPELAITWNRDSSPDQPLTTGDHYELRTKDGVSDATLYVRTVTDETKGIYICNIKNGSDLLDTVVLGLNVGEHKYRESIDKYRENLVIGGIAGASVFGFIILVGLLAHFRYLTEESLEKRRQRKEDRLRRKREARNGQSNTGFSNGATEMTETS